MLRIACGERRYAWAGGAGVCAIGKGGFKPAADKREGDGATPLGGYPLRWIYTRPDRAPTLRSGLEVRPLMPHHGWCDAADHPQYNRPVRLPFSASAESLWREDGLYDVIVVLGHNDDPVVPGLGSAIFLHCCKWDEAGRMKPTLGCVAMARDALIELLAHAKPGDQIDIQP
jgi:L,D-peptidoglycan transpeptidase YkuD (ErfK/YbiS/YcfS/YnhG family)